MNGKGELVGIASRNVKYGMDRYNFNRSGTQMIRITINMPEPLMAVIVMTSFSAGLFFHRERISPNPKAGRKTIKGATLV